MPIYSSASAGTHFASLDGFPGSVDLGGELLYQDVAKSANVA